MPITQLPSEQDTLILSAEIPAMTPEAAFDHFSRPDLITKWWPQKAEIEQREGGIYHLHWPAQNWTMRGEITTYDPGRAFGFTWKWDHDPAGASPLDVAIDFEPTADGGTAMRITHGPYDGSEDSQKEREGHLEGWNYFIGELERVATAGQGEAAPSGN